MPTWILDENIFRRALEAECTLSPEDLNAVEVMQFVQLHGKWVFTDAIRDRYWYQWRSRTCDGGLSLQMLMSFQELMADADRSVFLGEVSVVPGDYDPDDQFVVSAAAAAADTGVLVTTDGRLRKALGDEGVGAANGFGVVDIAGAIELQNQLARHDANSPGNPG